MAGRPSKKPQVGRKRRAKPTKKMTPLIFTRNGVTVRHIDIVTDQLHVEVAKLQGKIREALVRLDRRPRVRHFIIETTRFALRKVISTFPTGPLTPEQSVAEIGRYNFTLSDCAATLAKMKSEFHELNEARFTLRFGQTAVKRIAGWNSFKKDRSHIESIPDPEGSDGLDD